MIPDDPRVEETEGWRDLIAWLEAPQVEGEPKRSMSVLARQLKISQPAVRCWVTRMSRPTVGPLRDALCRLIGSDPERWVTTAEREARHALEQIAPEIRGAQETH